MQAKLWLVQLFLVSTPAKTGFRNPCTACFPLYEFGQLPDLEFDESEIYPRQYQL